MEPLTFYSPYKQTSHTYQGAKNSTRIKSWSPILLSKSSSVNSNTSLARATPATTAKNNKGNIMGKKKCLHVHLKKERLNEIADLFGFEFESGEVDTVHRRERYTQAAQLHKPRAPQSNHSVAHHYWTVLHVTPSQSANQRSAFKQFFAKESLLLSII